MNTGGREELGKFTPAGEPFQSDTLILCGRKAFIGIEGKGYVSAMAKFAGAGCSWLSKKIHAERTLKKKNRKPNGRPSKQAKRAFSRKRARKGGTKMNGRGNKRTPLNGDRREENGKQRGCGRG